MTFYLQFLKMWKSIVGCLLFPFLDKSIPCIVLWKSKYGNRYYCLNRNTFSIFRKVVPQKEKENTKFGKQVLFPNRDILWKPNENHKKNMNFMWKTWNFFRSIQEESYKEEIARRNIDVFLLDGRARVTDPTFPYKTSFNFTYPKVRIF